jgi:hypothetical protein
MMLTTQMVPKGYEVYRAPDGLWRADLVTDVSRITIYCGDWEYRAVDAARNDASGWDGEDPVTRAGRLACEGG